MKIIRHRINTLRELANLAPGLGAEIDLRTMDQQIILHHDAFQKGDAFEAFLQLWSRDSARGTLILNPKEDGLEKVTLELLRKYQIEDFFFLDLTIPTTVRLTYRENEHRVAVRISEYETLESAMHFKGKAAWLWIDSFSGQVPTQETMAAAAASFKLCLVSPELQGFPKERIADFFPIKGRLDAVCTKFPELWS